LALTALTLQLALSFGHVHFSGRCNSPCGTMVTGGIAKLSKIPGEEPTDSKSEYCAVCASIQLAHGSLPQPLFHLPSFFLNRTIEPAAYVAILMFYFATHSVSISRSSTLLVLNAVLTSYIS
jgi:hypothetical protein